MGCEIEIKVKPLTIHGKWNGTEGASEAREEIGAKTNVEIC